jgi:hypothetical protein
MRAYVSGLFPPVPGEWPHAWAVVEVDAGRSLGSWAATIAVHELVRELRDRPGTPMRDNLDFEWSSSDFSLTLGPARVTGSVADWRVLIRRLLAEAGSTGELYETPSARPWRAAPSEVDVRDLLAAASEDREHVMLTTTDSIVAEELGLAPSELVDLIGVGWVGYRGDGRPMSSRDDATQAALYAWGVPAQLAVIPGRPVDNAAILEPDIDLDASDDQQWLPRFGVPHPTQDGLVDADEVTHLTRLDPWDPECASVARSLRARRRRSFGFCRLCGTYSAPESKCGSACWECAAALL